MWTATDDQSATAAIKILYQTNSSSEPFQRFAREVATQTELTNEEFQGILPILDSCVPTALSRTNPAWLATPLAEPCRTRLGESPTLQEALTAISEIADTLARLHDRSLYHRDLKPENAYFLDERWVIGDFGLLGQPSASESDDRLTARATEFGSRNYLAPEMIVNADSSYGGAADIYSLGKLMWVLCTGQALPPPGPHILRYGQMGISAFVPVPGASMLDLLLSRMTDLEPSGRPTARETSDEIRAWLNPRSAQVSADDGSINLSHLAKRVITLNTPHLQTREDRQRRLLDLDSLAQPMALSLMKFLEDLHSAGIPDGSIQDWPTIAAYLFPEPHFESEAGVSRSIVQALPTPADDAGVTLWAGYTLRYNSERGAICGLGYILRSVTEQRVLWSSVDAGVLGSAHFAATTAKMLRAFNAYFPQALDEAISAAERAVAE